MQISSRGEAVVTDARDALRRECERRWVEVSDRVLSTALSASRRSWPVHARGDTGPFHVSEQVLVAKLREAIDGQVQGSAVVAIAVQVEGREQFAGVLIQVIARYGVDLLMVADAVRELAAGCLSSILGDAAPPVRVSGAHVHFSDVVAGDPRTTDPW